MAVTLKHGEVVQVGRSVFCVRSIEGEARKAGKKPKAALLANRHANQPSEIVRLERDKKRKAAQRHIDREAVLRVEGRRYRLATRGSRPFLRPVGLARFGHPK